MDKEKDRKKLDIIADDQRINDLNNLRLIKK